MATKLPWWRTDTYDIEGFTEILDQNGTLDLWGDHGPALVRAYPSGSTQNGWGLAPTTLPGGDPMPGFIENYENKVFGLRRAMYGYSKGKHGLALVMRSARLVCVDIDGKNGGFEHASELGRLPATRAEVSKSGNGYHLFYLTGESWTDEGFGEYADQIGIVQGVDIRAVGCVYHWPQQRWNDRQLSELPDWLGQRLKEKKQRIAATQDAVRKITTLDETEMLMAQHALIMELDKPIKPGTRNTTLFAIGNKLRLAGVADWQKEIERRGAEISLDQDEIERIVRNIERQP